MAAKKKKATTKKTSAAKGGTKKAGAKDLRGTKAGAKNPGDTKAGAQKKSAKKSASRAKKKSTARAKKPAVSNVIPIVHWEIQSRDAAKLHGFYADLFGWKIDANNDMKYGMVESAGKGGIPGGIGGTPDSTSRLVVYAQVEDIDPILAKVESLGGKTIMPRTDIGVVIMALFTDPEGNTFGVIEG